MIAKIKGKVLSVVKRATNKGKEYWQVQLMQVSPKDASASLWPVRFWDSKKVEGVKPDSTIEIEGSVGCFTSKNGGALLSFDVW